MSGITVPTIDQISGATVMIKLRNLITKFITFAQEVNDKIDEPLEQATQAVNTANLASQNATRASEVATNASNVATQASEDAENAVNIVQGYEDRLNTVEDYTDAIGDNVSALDTEIHTTRPYVDTNTEQTITGTKSKVMKKNSTFASVGNGTAPMIMSDENITAPSAGYYNSKHIVDMNGEVVNSERLHIQNDGTSESVKSIRKPDGTYRTMVTERLTADGRIVRFSDEPNSNDISSTLTTKGFVQATDGRNNLVHNIGNESIGGNKRFQALNYLGTTRSNGWKLLWRFKGDRGIPFIMVGGRTFILGIANRDIVRTRVLSDSETGRTYPQPIFKVGFGSDGERYIFVKGSYSAVMHIHYIDVFLHGNLYPIFDAIEWIGEDVDEPVVGDTYTQVIDSVDFGYVR